MADDFTVDDLVDELINGASYGDLLAALRKDLQLDASTDVLGRSVTAENLAAIDFYESPLTAANQTANGYLTFSASPYLTGRMRNDAFNNGPKVARAGLYLVTFYGRIDIGATGGSNPSINLEVWDAARSGAYLAQSAWIGDQGAAGMINGVNFSSVFALKAGEYIFLKAYGFTATTVLYGTGAWSSNYTVSYLGASNT